MLFLRLHGFHRLRWLALGAVAILAAGCAARGTPALECMTPDQREFVAHGLTSFTPDTTRDDLDAAFGVPIEAGDGHRAWRRRGSEAGERIAARFDGIRLVGLRIFEHRASRPGCGVYRGWTWDLVERDGKLVHTGF